MGECAVIFKDDRFSQLNGHDVKQDLVAGLTVAVVAIPLGMAFAIASGVKPEYGLYTTIVAGLIVALFGGSRFQIAGPTGAFIPILLAIVLQYGYENLLIAGFLAGVMLIMMACFKVGGLIKYIPRSVTIGFTAGIAVIIFTGQIENVLGLEGIVKKEYFHENIAQILSSLPTLNMYSLMIGLLGFLLIVFVPKLFPRVPVLLVALIIPAMISSLFFSGKLPTIGTAFGGISQTLPAFHFPSITWEKILLLWQPAFVIAMLGGIESLLSAVVADGMTGKQHRSNRELFGQGLANLITPLFGGIPATGAIARTATNIKSGAVSPLSGVFQSVFVLLTLLIFAPYASHIPLASMAPILMVVAFNMSEYKSFWQIFKLKSADSLVLVTTFLLTVFVNLTVAVPIGLLLAMLSFIKRISSLLEVKKLMPDESMVDDADLSYKHGGIVTYTVRGPLFFGAADRFATIMRSINKQPEVLILKMRHVSMIDVTGEAQLASLVKEFKKRKATVLIAELQEEPCQMLRKTGLFEEIGEQNFIRNTAEALDVAARMIGEVKVAE